MMNPRPKDLIPHNWDVPQVFKRRLGDRAGRQRLFEHDGHLMIVAHAPPHPDEPTRQARLFWRNKEGSWSSSANGAGLAALSNHLDEFNRMIDECDLLEDHASTSKEYFDVLDRIAPLKRTITNFHQVLEEARRLLPEDRDLLNFRDQAYDLTRTAELLYDATQNGMETAQTRRAEQQAEASMEMATAAHRLNWLVALFFPLATLTAVFGMELKSGIESIPAPWPFVGVCAVGIVAGIFLSAAVMRR